MPCGCGAPATRGSSRGPLWPRRPPRCSGHAECTDAIARLNVIVAEEDRDMAKRAMATALVLLLLLASTPAVRAQAPPPPGSAPAGGAAEAIGVTPPRLSYSEGAVSFWRPGAPDWAPAQINTPLAPGDELYTGNDGNIELQIGGRAYVRGWGAAQVGAANQELDVWDRWNYARTDALIESTSARYVPPQVYGADDLDHYGNWRVVPTYGSIWVPQGVPAGWAPYSTGRWIYDPHYGWTWVDTAPWGWAPYHYGRWVSVDGYWAWAPGPVVARPVYAPALVAFFAAPGIVVSAGAPVVSWVALSWGEPVVPW